MRFHALLLAFFTSSLAGCLLQPSITWLPNSQEFAFITKQPKPDLVIYNVETGKQRALSMPPDHHTVWPAVSPSGKVFAIAAGSEKPGAGPRLLIYDQQGTVTKSKSLGTADQFKDSVDKRISLFWTADGGKIVIATQGVTVIYDVALDSVTIVPKSLAMVIDKAPFTPDGQHFLAVITNSDSSQETVRPVLVDWDGKMTPIVTQGEMFLDKEVQFMLALPSYYIAHWDGDTAIISSLTQRIHVNYRELTATIEPSSLPKTAYDGTIYCEHTFPRTEHRLRIVVKEVPEQSNNWKWIVEVARPGEADWRVIVQKTDLQGVSIAPDNNHVAVLTRSENQSREIVVIDEQGAVAGKIDAGMQ